LGIETAEDGFGLEPLPQIGAEGVHLSKIDLSLPV
jgi:hypothetical protein